jgi:hypothetical protein
MDAGTEAVVDALMDCDHIRLAAVPAKAVRSQERTDPWAHPRSGPQRRAFRSSGHAPAAA